MISLFKKYQSVIAYLFFGGLTTLVNIITFAILQPIMNYQFANILAWIASVLFAYVTISSGSFLQRLTAY